MTDRSVSERAPESLETMGNLVKSLPEDSLSLAWRSELNEQLREMAPKVRRLAWLWQFGRPAVGLCLAGCLALVVTFRLAVAPQGEGLEGALIQTVAETTTVRDVTGAGLLPQELSQTTRDDVEETWSELDLGAL